MEKVGILKLPNCFYKDSVMSAVCNNLTNLAC